MGNPHGTIRSIDTIMLPIFKQTGWVSRFGGASSLVRKAALGGRQRQAPVERTTHSMSLVGASLGAVSGDAVTTRRGLGSCFGASLSRFAVFLHVDLWRMNLILSWCDQWEVSCSQFCVPRNCVLGNTWIYPLGQLSVSIGKSDVKHCVLQGACLLVLCYIIRHLSHGAEEHVKVVSDIL